MTRVLLAGCALALAIGASSAQYTWDSATGTWKKLGGSGGATGPGSSSVTISPFSLPVIGAASLGGVRGTGVDGGTTCSPGEAAVGFNAGTGALVCVRSPAVPPPVCSSAQVLTGVDGGFECRDPLSGDLCPPGEFVDGIGSYGSLACNTESDPASVHLTGTQTAAGAKTFSTSLATPSLTVAGTGYSHTIGAEGASVAGYVSGHEGLFSEYILVGDYTTATLPDDCTAGAIAYDTTDGLLKNCNAGGEWVAVSAAAALNVAAPITGAGTVGSPLTTIAATSSNAGHVSAGSQEFAGHKFFLDPIYSPTGKFYTLFGYDTAYRQGIDRVLAFNTPSGKCIATFVDGLLTGVTGDCPAE